MEERSRVIKQKVAELRSDDPLRRIEFKELGVGDDLTNNYLFALIKAQRGSSSTPATLLALTDVALRAHTTAHGRQSCR